MKDWNELFKGSLRDQIIVHEKFYRNSGREVGPLVYVWTERSNAYCYFRDVVAKKTRFYKTRLDYCNNGDDVTATGAVALASLSKYARNPELIHLHKKHEDVVSASNLLWYNEEHNGTETPNCIGYDRNSAYSWGMLQDMPDTTRPLGYGDVEPGQVGFNYDAPIGKSMIFEGFAMYRYPLMPSPFKRFVDNWYKKKKNAKTDMDKQHAKKILNLAVGNLQNCNCMLRMAIVEYSSKFMIDIINRHKDIILSSNTDSIVATEPIPEIEAHIGREIGEWKIEHTGTFAYSGHKYQWNHSKFDVSYRGTPKKWIQRMDSFNILEDSIPKSGNQYYMAENGIIKEVK